MQTLQGAFMLTHQTPETGGLVVIPNSWMHHDSLTNRATAYWGMNDEDNHFLLVPPEDEIFRFGETALCCSTSR